MRDSDHRNVIVANRVASMLGFLAIALFLILVFNFGFTVTSPIIFSLSFFFFLIKWMNKKGFINIGRTLLCVVPAATTLTAALLSKLNDPNYTDILYYDSRFFLIFLSIVPCLIFATTERYLLYGCLGFIFTTLILFDPVHEFFGLGYFQRGFTGRSYYYINYVSAITFFGIAAGSINLKRVIEKKERKNQKFEADLIEKNAQLSEALRNLERQKEEIVSQSDELLASQEQLVAANRLIEKQKMELQLQVNQANNSLEEANEELIRHNNELRQFSYTISHNLRGPIARLLGLAQVAKLDDNFDDNGEALRLISHIKTSALELDNVIRDLNQIVDIRNGINQLRQRIVFEKEWKEIRSLLHITDAMEAENFTIDFGEPVLFSVRPMVNSILYNLVSNAIKYQSPDRKLLIQLRSFQMGDYTVLEVSDNGLGINLKQFQQDLFKLYKRFHTHQEGKGLGLYLIKSQAESLNGYVECESEPDRGTTFSVYIKGPTEEELAKMEV
jgi:signal transduction histidine kinase